MSRFLGSDEQKAAWHYWAAWLLVLVAAIFCRVATLASESIGSDEVFSRTVAVSRLPDSMAIIRQDIVHPPLYYLLLKITVGLLGSGVTEIRVLSLFFGIATIGALALLPRWWPEWRAPALLAGALVAVNHQHITFSQQVRSYAFYAFLITMLLLWCFYLEKDWDSKVYWTFGSALMLAALYTHYISALYVGCIGGALLLGKTPTKIKRLTVFTLIAIFLLFTPWIVYISAAYQQKRGLDSNLGWITPPTLYELKAVWAEFLGIPPFPGATTVSFCLGAALVGGGLVSYFLRGASRHHTAILALAFTAVVPPLALFFLSMSERLPSFYGFRHLLPSLIPWCLLACYGLQELCRLSKAPRQIYAAGGATLLAIGLATSVVNRWSGPVSPRYEEMVEYLESAELRGVDAYTTWNGIRDTVNFYSGEERVTLLDEKAALPDRLVLLFRPTIGPEQAAFDRLVVADGYSVLKEMQYGDFPDDYPALVLLERRPATGPPR